MLEAVKMLKAEYIISSASAFYYLKSFGEYERLMREVEGNLEGRGVHGIRIPIRELALAVEKTQTVFNRYVDFCYAHADPEHSYGFEMDRIEPYSSVDKRIEHKLGIAKDFHFDYGFFLSDYFLNLSETGDREVAFFRSFVNAIIGDEEYFLSPDGDRIHADELLPDGIDTQNFLEMLDRYLSSDEPEEDLYRATSDYSIAEHHPEEDPTLSMLCFFIRKPISKGLFYEESACLFRDIFGTYLPDRSRRERTRNSLQVERRVALNSVSAYHESGQTPEETLQLSIQEKTESVDKVKRRLESNIKRNAPDIVIKADSKQLDNLQYELLVLKRNRAWLKKVLER